MNIPRVTGAKTGVLLGSVLGLGLCIACATSPASSKSLSSPPEVTFDKYEIETDHARRLTVMTGFFLGRSMADLAVVRTDNTNNRHLQIFGFQESNWEPALMAALDPKVIFVDVARIDGRDRLLTYKPGGLNWFDPDSATEHPLVSVTSIFQPPHRGEIPHVDITRDLNQDGRDDLVVPDRDGFWIFTQGENGDFADPVKIGPRTEMARILGADGYRYDPWSASRLHEMDYNHDGKNDLVFWDQDHFKVHLQNGNGLFDPKSKTFTTDVIFDSDEFSHLTTGTRTGRILHSIADLNGDDIGDLVVFSLAGRTIADKHSSYEVHFGVPASEGSTVFAPEIGILFQTDDRIQLALDEDDFDRDGRVDMMITTIAVGYLEPSFFKRILRHLNGKKMSFGMMGDDIWLDLEFYQMKDGHYPDKPNAIRRIALDGSPSSTEPGWVPLDLVLQGGTHEDKKGHKDWPRAFNPNLLLGDVTGDGHSDLLIEPTFRGFALYAGIPGPDLFVRNSEEVRVILPHDREYSWLVDLNQDGKQDILLHYPFTLRDVHGGRLRPPGTEPHRVTLMIAQ